MNHIYHWRKVQTTTFIRHRSPSTTATTVRINSTMSHTAREDTTTSPTNWADQEADENNNRLLQTNPWHEPILSFPTPNVFSNDIITANEHIEKIKKHQPICHKHQFPNSLPALEPLPWTSPLLPISTNSITNWTTNPMTKSTQSNCCVTDKQRRMDKVWDVLSRIYPTWIVKSQTRALYSGGPLSTA